MKLLAAFVAIAFDLGISLPTSKIEARVPGKPGLDVSAGQGNVNWASAKSNGAQFAYMKASPRVLIPQTSL